MFLKLNNSQEQNFELILFLYSSADKKTLKKYDNTVYSQFKL